MELGFNDCPIFLIVKIVFLLSKIQINLLKNKQNLTEIYFDSNVSEICLLIGWMITIYLKQPGNICNTNAEFDHKPDKFSKTPVW